MVRGGRREVGPGSRTGDGASEAGRNLRWRVLVDPPLGGAANMARDHALAETLPAGAAVLRLYRWAHPTASFGRNEPARERWRPRVLADAGVDAVRRPTGGRAVLHHRELTYAAVLPLPDRRWLRPLYRRVNQALVAGLARLGVAVETEGARGVTAPPGAGPCFGAPAPDEVVAGGRKLVGSAQVRMGCALLQHGSLLVHDDQGLLEDLAHARPGDAEGRRGPPPATLAGLLGRVPEWDELVAALVAGFTATFGGDWPGGAGEDTLPRDAGRREAELLARYASGPWTWRR